MHACMHLCMHGNCDQAHSALRLHECLEAHGLGGSWYRPAGRGFDVLKCCICVFAVAWRYTRVQMHMQAFLGLRLSVPVFICILYHLRAQNVFAKLPSWPFENFCPVLHAALDPRMSGASTWSPARALPFRWYVYSIPINIAMYWCMMVRI